MINQQRVLAIVPARSGSKGLPHKNIRPLCGKPLLAWSIESAISCPYIDNVVLSTDSQQYADIGVSYGANVPFLRPDDIACDTASSIDVILHALDHLDCNNDTYEIVALFEPTSPLRRILDVNKAIEYIAFNQSLASVSICQAESIHPAFMYRYSPNKHITPFLGTHPSDLRRQDIEPLYFLEGSIYASNVSALRAYRSFYHDNTAGVVVPYERSPEVDSELDFLFIESLLNSNILK